MPTSEMNPTVGIISVDECHAWLTIVILICIKDTI